MNLSIKHRVGRILREAEKYKSKRFIRSFELAVKFLDARPADAFPPDYLDLAFLYRLVRARRPKTVVEFGCGCSTIAIALALQENSKESKSAAKLWSFDGDEHWANICQASLPEELIAYCEVAYRPAEVVDFLGKRAFQYQMNYDFKGGIDFVYLDGPALTDECRSAIDPIRMEQHFNPNCTIVVDGRTENVELLKRGFNRKYSVQNRHRYFNTVFTCHE